MKIRTSTRPSGEGMTATERVKVFRQRLRRAGGATVTFHLGPEALRALRALSAPGEGNQLIERLLAEELRRRHRSTGAGAND